MTDWRQTARRGIAAAALVAASAVAAQGTAVASSHITVTGVAPHALGQGAARTFTITGTGFTSGAFVEVSGDGVTVSDTHVVSSTRLTTKVAASLSATVGKRSVRVQVLYDGASLGDALRVASAPTLTGIVPGHVVRSGRGVRLALTGTGFERGMRVAITGASVRTATVGSATSATVVATLGPGVPLGTTTVSVTNPDGGSTSLPLIVDASPQVASISSPMITLDETTTETLQGTGFEPGVRISVGPSVGVRVGTVTPTQLTATFVVHAGAQVGPRTLTVTNPDGGTLLRPRAIHLDYAPILTRWAVGDGAVTWRTTLKRPTFAGLPSLSFSGTGVTIATETVHPGGVIALGFTIASDAATTWRTLTMHYGTASTWVVPRFLKVRAAPKIFHFPSLPRSTAYRTVTVTGANFEVCAQKNPIVSVSGTGVTVNQATVALGDVMYVNVSITASATIGTRDVTVTNCDSGGRRTSVGVFSVTA